MVLQIEKTRKISFEEMIQHLDEKGIKFERTTKKQAQEILMNSNFFYKIRSFRKNFEKNENGKYLNLDFFMLNDLATLDMRLRYILIHMCLDLEHTLKTKLVKDITLDNKENGKDIVEQFLENRSKKSLEDYYNPLRNPKHPNHGIYRKFNNVTPPIWVFCELITFGELVAFIEYYCYKYLNKPTRYYKPLGKNLKFIKNIRNLAAHNSPIINEITGKNQISFKNNIPNIHLHKFLNSACKTDFRDKVTNAKIHDLCSLIFIYDTYITSTKIKGNRYNELKEYMDRCKRNKEEYSKHDNIISVFNFFNKIVDYISKKL
ncbi:hypothetical protein M948_20550 [Virgibacillus sp. CM-4]|uniref:Abi family protein n=1 Tax=Virgibacillus sp. CM-4 TaxID=1354277 RepID=UPI0003884D35|nr:Abi family protein [Virgibacillus sp. CM-4]EQB34779.1 hypothetical protein M948_20550 [Virgibacillus sp. CM-4]